MDEPRKLIYELMPRVMRDIGAIPKSQMNKGQDFPFRGIDDVLRALHPILIDHEITLSTSVSDLHVDVPVIIKKTKAKIRGHIGEEESEKSVFQTHLSITIRFYAVDGSFVEGRSYGEGIDWSGDKATAKAMSAAFKQAIFFVLCVPIKAADIIDADRDDHVKDMEGEEAPGKTITTSNAREKLPAENLKPTGKVMEPGKPKKNPDPRQFPDRPDGPCRSEQQSQIKVLATELKMTGPQLTAVIIKRGKKKLSELTSDQADGIIVSFQHRKEEAAGKN